MMDKLFTESDPKPKPRQHHYSPLPDNDIHRFVDDRSEQLYELFGPVSTEDYKNVAVPYVSFTPEIQPTQSEVEVH